jgi:DNA-binding Xre family transcriptional regulator
MTFIIDALQLKLAMARNCLSGYKLAKKAGVAPETVTSIYRTKNKRKCVSVETAGKLAAALGVDITEIIKKN